jgi:hypothetical protein
MFAGNIGGEDDAKDEGEAGSYGSDAGQYRGASKKEKRMLLDQFVSTHGIQPLVRPVRVAARKPTNTKRSALPIRIRALPALPYPPCRQPLIEHNPNLRDQTSKARKRFAELQILRAP